MTDTRDIQDGLEHRFSTLVPAQQVRDLLATDRGIDDAIAWCNQTRVTKIYIETFRDNYQVPREVLVHARDRFRDAGIEVSGCVTTTKHGKQSTGWDIIVCHTDQGTQEHLKEIFAFAAELFDEVMIDDFLFTDCECADCEAGRSEQVVRVGDREYPVPGDTWSDYRCELMVHVSRECILAPAREANPNVKVIVKFPEWYDLYRGQGYEMVRQTEDFDRIWVGTETRDFDNPEWGGRPKYQGYFVMRYLKQFGGDKCGGGWFDPYGTTEASYIEQARQTVLGGADESLLFCYGSLLEDTGPANVDALRDATDELMSVAWEVAKREPVGVAAYRPPVGAPGTDAYVFDSLGMIGLPLVPCHEFPSDARAVFVSTHALADADLVDKLRAMLTRGAAVLVTDTLADALRDAIPMDASNLHILPIAGKPKSLLELSQDELDAIRSPLLRAIDVKFSAPNQVALYLFEDGSWVVENFNDAPVTVTLDGREMNIPARGWCYEWVS